MTSINPYYIHITHVQHKLSGLYPKPSFCSPRWLPATRPRQLSMTARCGVLDGQIGEGVHPKTLKQMIFYDFGGL